jgi:methyl acetate hydrolase
MVAFEMAMKQTIDSGEVPGSPRFCPTPTTSLRAAHGRRCIAASDAMTPNTIFWFASMTKAIVSAGSMQLVEQGEVELDEAVERFLPALAST